MQVILLERVAGLGSFGTLVKVKAGYARNFLLPRGKALPATEDNKRKFEKERHFLESRITMLVAGAGVAAEQLKGRRFFVVRSAGEMGQLYGSVSSRDIASLITSDVGLTISRSQVILNAPIKTLGVFPVLIRLYPEVEVEIRLKVVRSLDEVEAPEMSSAEQDSDSAPATEQASYFVGEEQSSIDDEAMV